MCDWNNDGLLDLVTGERYGFYTVFLRNPDSTLTNAGRIQAGGADMVADTNSWPFVVDWNLDGRKDLLIGQEGLGSPSNVYVYLNQGTDSAPAFDDSTAVLHSGNPFADRRTVPLLIELDGDGKRDLVLGEWYSSVRFYTNVGTDTNPAFNTYVNLVRPDSSTYLNGNPPRINFTDWDGDGDLDMITCDYYGSVFLRRNITPAAIEEQVEPQASSHKLQATVLRGVLVLPRDFGAGHDPNARHLGSCPKPSLLDASGREVLDLRPGPNDVSRLAPGVYFVRDGQTQTQAVRKVVLTD